MRSLARWTTWMALGAALAACGGGDKPAPPAGFTAAMIQGRTFYEEALTPPNQEKVLITFSSGTGATLSIDEPAGPSEAQVTWSIDGSGRLVLQAGLARTTMTLVADGSAYLDVTADDGTGPSSARLFKTIPFGAALQDRFAVADRDLAGATRTNGVVSFDATTMVSTDGFSESSMPWSQAADGTVTLAKPGEETVVYLRADSVVSSPKSLHLVGRVRDALTSDLRKIADSLLTETPASSGFTTAMVEGAVVYRKAPAARNRSIIRYDVGGVREEWYEQDLALPQHRVGTWTLLPQSGSLVALPATGLAEVAAMLVDDAQEHWDLLVNTGTGGGSAVNPAIVTKTVVADRPSLLGTWSATEHLLNGTTAPLGTITLNDDGTGTGPTGAALHWTVDADGSIIIAVDGASDVTTFFTLATTAPPSLELAGFRYTGSAFAGTTVLTMTR